ncbi:MAG: HAMP domain-containing histidine kinase, partial [Candidatus Sericytochromatia bacterium]|nr:HAMP domain-containing histidine kinase [Candidatus Sericytochromatia bacterium]
LAIAKAFLPVLQGGFGGSWSALCLDEGDRQVVVATHGDSPFRVGKCVNPGMMAGRPVQAMPCWHGDLRQATLLLDAAQPLRPEYLAVLAELADRLATLLWARRQDEDQASLAARCAELEGHLARVSKVSALALLSAGLFHELHNPLLITGSYLETMSDELAILGQLTEAVEAGRADDLAVLSDSYDLSKAVARLRNAQQEGRHALRQAAMVLRDFRAVAGDFPAEGAYDVGALCEEVVRLVRPTFAPAVAIRLTSAAVVPVTIRRSALHQILLNLIINACQAAGQGGHVQISLGCDGAGVMITVGNDGATVDPAILPLIFQPFVTTKATSGGTGLGLAICRQLIEPVGGRIEVEAQAAWTTFRVHLPIVSLQQ